MTQQPPVALTISGSDSSGGAGLQADLATFSAHGVHGACAVTLVSAQNTAEFRAAVPMPAALVIGQIEAVLADMAVMATKTGLLFTDANINAVATIAEHGRLPLLVVDPVMVGMNGKGLYDQTADRLIAERLVPQAAVLTPNHLEAGRLLGRELCDDGDALLEAAHELAEIGPEAVVITGGRRRGDVAEDIAVIGGKERTFTAPWIDTVNVRGSGDTFSAAIAASLAVGTSVQAAIERAHTFTQRALKASSSWRLGAGQGPLGHFL